jgi:simple sugar transport system permease protein
MAERTGDGRSSTQQAADTRHDRVAALTAAIPQVEAPRTTARHVLRRNGLTFGTLGVALLMWVLFIVAAPEVFLTSRIYQAFATTTPLFAMMALALTLIVITGEIDLSFISVMALGMVGFVRVYELTGNVVLALLGCLLVGLACGLFNGFLIALLGIPSLVITLGTMFFFRGIELVLLNARGVALTGDEFAGLRTALNGRLFGVPNELLWTVAVAVALWVLLNRTRFGAHVFLIGDNATSAQLMGVRVARVKVATYMLMAVVAAFTGLVASMQVSYLWPTLGEGSLLSPIAAVFLGGTSVFGGVGSIVGTFIGAFVIGAINAGIISAGIDGFYTQLFFGLVIIVSLVIQTIISRRLRG